MNMYYGILLWFAVMAFFTSTTNVEQKEYILGKKVRRYQWTVALIIFVPLIIWAAYRPKYFGDTASYMKAFSTLPTSLSDLFSYLDNVSKDKGFTVLSILIKCIIGERVRIYFFILAAIQGVCMVSMYRKYSPNYLLAVFIFVACSDYFSFMQNGIRQMMAVSISVLGFKYLVEKKYIPFVLIILLASTMHQSVLLLLPIALIVQGQAWNRRTILMLIAALIAVAFVDRFTNILDTMLSDTQYTNVVSDWQEWQDNGTNPLRVLVYATPAILSVIGLRFIRKANDPVINLATNMSLVTVGIYIISMFTSGIFIGRLPIYTSTYAMGILLPWEVEHMFNKESSRLMKIFMIIAFLGFYYFQMHFTWGTM